MDGALPRPLLEPLSNVVLRVEEVDQEADPAGGEHQDGADDFTHEGDGLLEDVENGDDGQYEADEIDNHDKLNFKKNVLLVQEIQYQPADKHVSSGQDGLLPGFAAEPCEPAEEEAVDRVNVHDSL